MLVKFLKEEVERINVSWTKAEEKVLIDGLLEISNALSWKANGSFSSGFRNILEEKLNEKFPGCGLKANPHIESKIKWFKDKYNVLTAMFRTSGFSWDEEKKMILSERQYYNDYYKVIPPLHPLFLFLYKPLRYNYVYTL
ncbi:Oligoendopeptidase F chromosomal [Bienertia sinuspersici]